MPTRENIEALIGIFALLGVFATIVRIWTSDRMRLRQNIKEGEKFSSALESINTRFSELNENFHENFLNFNSKLDQLAIETNKVKLDGLENIRLTNALHTRVDKVERTIRSYRVKQARLEERVKTLVTPPCLKPEND